MIVQRWSVTGVVAVLVVFCCTSESYAEKEHSIHPIWIFEDGLDRQVQVEVPEGTVIEYANHENCGEPEHRTEHGSYFYAHVHITYSLSQEGWDQYSTWRVVTQAKIDAYWNRPIAGRYGFPYFTQLSSADHKRNCASHAFLVGPWVQSAGADLILESDYRPTGDELEEENVLCAEGVFHMARLQALCPYFQDTVKETTEENKESGIYKATFSCPGPTPSYAFEERP